MNDSFITGVGIPLRRVTRQDLDDLVLDAPTQPPYCLRSLKPSEFDIKYGPDPTGIEISVPMRHFSISNVEVP